MVTTERGGKGSTKIEALKEMATKQPERLLQRLDGLIELTKDSDDNIRALHGYMEEGLVPVIYANHQSHADKFALSGITQQLQDRDKRVEGFQNFLVPIAASIGSGDQGEELTKLVKLFEPVYAARGYGPDVPIITANDREKRGQEGDNKESLKRLRLIPDEHRGLVLFPETTLQGGRKSGEASIYGMQKLTDTALLSYPKVWQRRGFETVFLPVGISGTNTIMSPDEGQSGISSLALRWIKGVGDLPSMAQITAGEPFTYENLKKELGEEINPKSDEQLDFMMARVAKLVPPQARGYYADKV